MNIAVSECRVFQTKERSPCMIAVELYRPDELNLYADEAGASSISHLKKEASGDVVIEDLEHQDGG